MAVREGEIVDGRFKIGPPLAYTASATVFRAYDIEGKQAAAVKVLQAATRRSLKRFARESSLLATIKHPHVVQLIAAGVHNGSRYLAMELVRGGSVGDFLVTHRRFLPSHGLSIAFQTLMALAVVHDLGIVHRDIKPENLLIRRKGHIKVTDFGVAQIGAPMESRRLTVTGTRLGSEDYVAPEQWNDARSATPASDIYSVGSLLYGITVGNRPPPLGAARFKPELLNPVLPPMRALVAKATRLEPHKRFQSAREMAEAVAALYQELEGGRAEREWIYQFDAHRRSVKGRPFVPIHTLSD